MPPIRSLNATQSIYCNTWSSCRLDVRFSKNENAWHISTLKLERNHPPMPDIVATYTSRHVNLTDDMKAFIGSMAKAHIPPQNIVTCYEATFPEGPVLIAREITRMCNSNSGGGSDAQKLLELLHAEASKDSTGS